MVIPATDTTVWQWASGWLMANLIAFVALLQPYIYWLWKKYLRRGRVDIHKTAKVEVGFSGFGATIGLYGTVRAVDEDYFIRSIELDITRTTDDAHRRFEWLAFRGNTLSTAGTPSSLELASGFMLLTSAPQKYNILFVDQRFQEAVAAIISPVRDAWGAFVQTDLAARAVALLSPEQLDDLYRRFAQTPAHVTAFGELEREFDWRPVEYCLAVKVKTANPNREFRHWFRFRLADNDITNLRVNSLRILQEACGRPTIGPYHFAYCSYLPSNGTT